MRDIPAFAQLLLFSPELRKKFERLTERAPRENMIRECVWQNGFSVTLSKITLPAGLPEPEVFVQPELPGFAPDRTPVQGHTGLGCVAAQPICKVSSVMSSSLVRKENVWIKCLRFKIAVLKLGPFLLQTEVKANQALL